jgi:hypothetical protein
VAEEARVAEGAEEAEEARVTEEERLRKKLARFEATRARMAEEAEEAREAEVAEEARVAGEARVAEETRVALGLGPHIPQPATNPNDLPAIPPTLPEGKVPAKKEVTRHKFDIESLANITDRTSLHVAVLRALRVVTAEYAFIVWQSSLLKEKNKADARSASDAQDRKTTAKRKLDEATRRPSVSDVKTPNNQTSQALAATEKKRVAKEKKAEEKEAAEIKKVLAVVIDTVVIAQYKLDENEKKEWQTIVSDISQIATGIQAYFPDGNVPTKIEDQIGQLQPVGNFNCKKVPDLRAFVHGYLNERGLPQDTSLSVEGSYKRRKLFRHYVAVTKEFVLKKQVGEYCDDYTRNASYIGLLYTMNEEPVGLARPLFESDLRIKAIYNTVACGFYASALIKAPTKWEENLDLWDLKAEWVTTYEDVRRGLQAQFEIGIVNEVGIVNEAEIEDEDDDVEIEESDEEDIEELMTDDYNLGTDDSDDSDSESEW